MESLHKSSKTIKRVSKKISVVIPTLNEEKYILKCIKALIGRSEIVPEIIVVDAGSSDDTISLLSNLQNVQKIVDKDLKGKKYASLNKGAAIAKEKVLLFLDADTIVPENFDLEISNSLNDIYGAGAFNLEFDRANSLLLGIALMNKLRYKLTKRYYGDQGIFCEKELFEKVKGFPEIEIMEAAHFCQKLKSETKLCLIRKAVMTSNRRFENQGVLRVFFNDLKILIMDVLGMDVSSEGKRYWTKIDR